MANLKFKIKKYNMGGYLQFANGGFMDQDPAMQDLMQKDKDSEKQADMLASGVSKVPVYGQFVAAGLKLGQGIGSQTKDSSGIYKSKAGEFVDSAFNPNKGIADLTDLGHKWDWGSALNIASQGMLGTNQRQQKLKAAQHMQQLRSDANQYSMNQEAGAASRAAVGGFTAAPYGRKGMKLGKFSKFSMSNGKSKNRY